MCRTRLGGGGLTPFVFSFTIASTRSDCHWQCSSQERPTKILSALLWSPSCTNAYVPKLTPCGEVVSNVMSPFWPPLPCIIQAAFERGLSTSWLMQTESAQVGVRPDARSVIATCYTPGIKKVVPHNVMELKKPHSSQVRPMKILTTLSWSQSRTESNI